jgi:hypothetical protein
MAGQVVAELHDELGQVRLVGGDPGPFQSLVHPDLGGGHRLHLDHVTRPGVSHKSGDDLVGLGGVPGEVHRTAGRGDPLLQGDEQVVEVGQRGRLDGLRRQPQVLPGVELGHHPVPLGPDGVRSVAQVDPEPVIPQRSVGPGGKRGGPLEPPGHPCAPVLFRCPVLARGSVLARISARCMVRNGVPS